MRVRRLHADRRRLMIKEKIFPTTGRTAAHRIAIGRIAMVIAILAVSRLIVFLLRALSRFIIFFEWGPLRFAYRTRKNRALTIHSLVLSILKYVIYFVAIGFVLTELGIDYRAYIASLSVIGLAIGFGSQGLVQDVVTGFFIIFEGQFGVGDMVEISGQVGMVEELGLRVTRLRNYFGASVVIQNRNIAMVGNYGPGGLRGYVDVAVSNAEAAKTTGAILATLAGEIGRQFEGVFLKQPTHVGPLTLETGEHFVRLQVALWPLQQWVIDQQLVPRVREALKASGIEVPGDRVIAFYRVPERRPASRIRGGRGRTARRQTK